MLSSIFCGARRSGHPRHGRLNGKRNVGARHQYAGGSSTRAAGWRRRWRARCKLEAWRRSARHHTFHCHDEQLTEEFCLSCRRELHAQHVH